MVRPEGLEPDMHLKLNDCNVRDLKKQLFKISRSQRNRSFSSFS